MTTTTNAKRCIIQRDLFGESRRNKMQLIRQLRKIRSEKSANWTPNINFAWRNNSIRPSLFEFKFNHASLLTFENLTQNCQIIDLHVIDVFLPSEPHKKYKAKLRVKIFQIFNFWREASLRDLSLFTLSHFKKNSSWQLIGYISIRVRNNRCKTCVKLIHGTVFL
jgi:hypothetical protein